MTDTLTEKRGLTSNSLKYIVVITMLLDHIGWYFLPIDSAWAQIFHFVGRFTAPVMCYFVAEGYHYTHDIKKYLQRLLIFALICHPLFVFKTYYLKYGLTGFVFDPSVLLCQSSVFVTLFLGLLALVVWYSDLSTFAKVSLIVIICGVSFLGDWMFLGVLWVLFFGIFRGDFKKQLIAYYCVASFSIIDVVCTNLYRGIPLIQSVWTLGLIFPPLLIALYNGKRGSTHPFNKWFFYIFYPAHLVVLVTLKVLI